MKKHRRVLTCGVAAAMAVVALAVKTHAQACGAWQHVAKLVAEDAHAGSNFGRPVAIKADVAVVGAWGDGWGGESGATYVYSRSAMQWQQVAKLVASDGELGDRFGHDIDFDGETIIVGSPYSDAPIRNSGAAYLFRRSGTSWSQAAKLIPADPVDSGFFGLSVSVWGRYAAVGASFESSVGAVYVFYDNGMSWIQVAKLMSNWPRFGDIFGWSVKINQRLLIVGEYSRDELGVNSGAAHVYRLSDGSWVREAMLTASDGRENDNFGSSVDTDGSVVVVGAMHSDAGGIDGGAVYVFNIVGGDWIETARLLAEDTTENDKFGARVAMDGDRIAVASWLDDDRGIDSGTVNVFQRTNGAWAQIGHLLAFDGRKGDQFSSGVDIDGTTVLVGASGSDTGGIDSGAAYVLEAVSSPPACAVDLNHDGQVDFLDYLEFLNLYEAGCQ